ncbi:capsule biosynthesis protein [Halovulum sp. GXIMD14793]
MTDRHFLFLQGPHGRFFSRLAGALKQAGCGIHRIGFNAGDRFFWKHRNSYTAFEGALEAWRGFLTEFLAQNAVTDIVIYGDTREIHVTALELARANGIRCHCFEEGYLRPYWVTYERDGVNGHSPLMDLSIAEIRQRLPEVGHPQAVPPAQWGALWHHIYLGAIYHWMILFRNQQYRAYQTHRAISVRREWWLHFRRLAKMPVDLIINRAKAARLEASGAAYHVVLMQLAHDSSFIKHSDFERIGDFVDLVVQEFAKGAPQHHKLVFKFHPLEDDRAGLPQLIRTAAAQYGVSDRVHYLRGGKLGPLLDKAKTAVTVNSTAGQQALWRGMPLRVFGRCIYDKPELISTQPLDEFFAMPRRPDKQAYLDFRDYLLQTSQFAGGFYTERGRAQILRDIVDVMLSDRDPYALQAGTWPLRDVLLGERGTSP